ncbi:MAG TPA: GDP-mannose 4,6-dehydratase [Candidatus Thermoplasmatota archaeon]|nr:GDP-mannose 4,6-dehydratase [Candidatus Thermoplasmatota archaeon]
MTGARGGTSGSRLLVTGCAGFIASKVAEQALDAGHEVVGIDDLNDYYDVRLKQWRLDRLRGRKGFSFHQQDIADLEAMKGHFKAGQFDAILNLGARAGVRYSTENPWIYQRTNVEGTLNLLEMARRHNVPKLVLASTSSLYGSNNPLPFKEDANTDRPLSPYAASKKGAEALCASYSHLYGIATPIPRYFTVYGPAGRPDMAPYRFIDWISRGVTVTMYGDGTQRRDFTYVDDIARGTLATLQKHVKGFDIYNLGGDRPIVLTEFLAMVEKAVGKKAIVKKEPRHEADMEHTWADITKARTVLKWEPTVKLEEGIRRTVDWYQKEWQAVLVG